MTTTNRTSHPIALRDATVTDPFWASRQELVRTQVIPYQWNALNDNVPGAAPSYCMHNFKAAAAQNAEHHKEGKAFVPPKYTFRGFEALPDDPAHPDSDKFYGFVFQDTDFSKWIEAVGYSLTHHPDADLEATADTAIDIVCAAQLDNGYLDTYYILNGMDRHFTNLKDHHELYCFGHLTEGAIAYYQATGKRKLLDAACRFADYIDSRFGTADGKLHGYPGHEIAEMALVNSPRPPANSAMPTSPNTSYASVASNRSTSSSKPAAAPGRTAATTRRASRTTPTTRPTSRSRNRRRPSDTPSAPPTSTPEPPTWHA